MTRGLVDVPLSREGQGLGVVGVRRHALIVRVRGWRVVAVMGVGVLEGGVLVNRGVGAVGVHPEVTDRGLGWARAIATRGAEGECAGVAWPHRRRGRVSVRVRDVRHDVLLLRLPRPGAHRPRGLRGLLRRGRERRLRGLVVRRHQVIIAAAAGRFDGCGAGAGLPRDATPVRVFRTSTAPAKEFQPVEHWVSTAVFDSARPVSQNG